MEWRGRERLLRRSVVCGESLEPVECERPSGGLITYLCGSSMAHQYSLSDDLWVFNGQPLTSVSIGWAGRLIEGGNLNVSHRMGVGENFPYLINRQEEEDVLWSDTCYCKRRVCYSYWIDL